MKLIDKYLLRTLLVPLAYCLAAFAHDLRHLRSVRQPVGLHRCEDAAPRAWSSSTLF